MLRKRKTETKKKTSKMNSSFEYMRKMFKLNIILEKVCAMNYT